MKYALKRLKSDSPYYTLDGEHADKISHVMDLFAVSLPRIDEYIELSMPDFKTEIYKVAQVKYDARTGNPTVYAHLVCTISG